MYIIFADTWCLPDVLRSGQLCDQKITKIKKTYRDEEVRAASLILLPGIAVLLLATLDVTVGAVHNHDSEESRVEPWER